MNHLKQWLTIVFTIMFLPGCVEINRVGPTASLGLDETESPFEKTVKMEKTPVLNEPTVTTTRIATDTPTKSETKTQTPMIEMTPKKSEPGSSLPFITLAQDASPGDGRQEAAYLLAANPNHLESWRGKMPQVVDISGLSSTDFERFFLIGVYQGVQPTGGYGIQIHQVDQIDNVVNVRVQKTEPGPDAMLIQVLTVPYHIIRVEKDHLQVRGEITFVFLEPEGLELSRDVYDIP